MDTVNILIIARGNYLQILNDFFMANESYNLIGSTYDISHAKRLVQRQGKVVAALDYNGMDDSFFDELILALRPDNIRIIAICDTIKEGFDLLGRGASDMCIRPKSGSIGERRTFLASLSLKISKLIKDYDENLRILKNKFSRGIKNIIAIGSSTGGTECILKILKGMPEGAPPILVVQHMPPVFTKLYSQRLNRECAISVWEGQDGDMLENGLAIIAPGNKQMRLKYGGGKYFVSCTDELPVGGHIPAVDVLFDSIALTVPKQALGIILTGMGKDGAKGLYNMRKNGAFTIGQDEESCIVYGMPKAAFDIGAVDVQANPDKIIEIILKHCW